MESLFLHGSGEESARLSPTTAQISETETVANYHVKSILSGISVAWRLQLVNHEEQSGNIGFQMS